MAGSNANGVETNTCFYCNGVWIGGDGLEQLLSIDENAPTLDEIIKFYRQNANFSDDRFCPICDNQLLHVTKTKEVEIDICVICNGVFFDEGEIKKVLPNTHAPKFNEGFVAYVVSEAIFWVLLGLFSG